MVRYNLVIRDTTRGLGHGQRQRSLERSQREYEARHRYYYYTKRYSRKKCVMMVVLDTAEAELVNDQH